ncbi:response regulator [Cytophagales bacterium RKSG123]|nr:response regulator [Xanthovirga aplysinae]
MKRSELNQKLALEQYKYERENELNQDKFRFFTNLSHELRTPLTLILGPLDRMIRNTELNNKMRQNLLLIQKQASRLQKLTNQLMDFRKYEIHNLKLKAGEENVVDFIQEIGVAFKHHARMKQISFELVFEENELKLYYDRDKLEIILVNLLSNAFKFTSSKDSVKLKIRRNSVEKASKLMISGNSPNFSHFGEFSAFTKKVLEIEVSDTGVGIHQNQLKHVFDRYFQASNIETISVGGSGIGLEITKNYVELHHGCIMVKSEVGVGTTFYVWLPMGKAHLSENEMGSDFKSNGEKVPKQVEKQSQKKYAQLLEVFEQVQPKPDLSTILVIDDNPEILYFLQESFEKNFNLLTAQNGKIGLEKAFKHIPDIIISDIMMPEVDGLELCHQLKSDVRTSHIPIILLTAKVSNVFQAEGLETGADDYITKPFDEKILSIRVKNLIESRKKLRQRYSKEFNMLPSDIAVTQPDEEFLNKVIKIIEDNISDTNLKVDRIAKEIGMSHSVLYKKLMALTDLTVVEFIRTIRLKQAAVLLNKNYGSITQVSHEVGFTDPKYFSKCFQRFYGVIPSAYKKEITLK